ncbi:ATP-dependent Clp protease proteolytic subunit-related protein 4, chloroplastic [Durio zibethinus]|uniref:ATP-dependent Clp protease proteolytic subunit n=1 Tax=Durio zibethinus TaxID=66656 RepID=A0A6P6A002_DURZI|nr:ATP-dependent Clp protease proteolytic subunit-related protein 4, chloroplastic [Durio zibethinus]XP_022758121.1 ATP-dependent Clp protease proteolytic subunit-related protein 4, chloroplastic [Durio zibethinus]
MEVATATATATAPASRFVLHAHMLSPSTFARTVNPNGTLTTPPSAALRTSLSTNFLSPFPAIGSVSGDFSGFKLRPDSLNPASLSRSKPKRGVVPMVIPFTEGSVWEQPPPDLASYLYKNRIVYLGMSLVPSVTELLLAEFLYLQYEDAEKPIFMYINSTGVTKSGRKLGYENQAFAVYDTMSYIEPPVFTLCVGNAWGEAALLLAAGAAGNRSALPSSSIMIRQPMARFQGQATDVEIARKEIKLLKTELVNLYAKHTGQSTEQIEADIRRPKYFSPSEAVEYGIIDKVLYNERSPEDRGVVSDLKKGKLI